MGIKMLRIQIPGKEVLLIENFIFDYNGTIATDGKIPENIKERLEQLSQHVNIYVATADTYGNAKSECDKYGLNVKILTNSETRKAKCEFVKELNPQNTVCLGNGFNDIDMLSCAILSIGVFGDEGIYAGILNKCDIVVNSIENGLDLFLKPNRLVALLRD